MRVGSLFSGIGGFDLGLERAGMEIIWQCEIDPFCNKVLAKHWPNVKRYGDIKELNGSELEPVDLICGGFPCQPYSCAGKRMGAEDDRALWPEMLRVIQEARPRWVIGENVAGFINMGLDQSISDLEREGYTVQAFIIPACSVNAPHRRDRVWILGGRTDVNDSKGGGCGILHTENVWKVAGKINASSLSDCHAADTGNQRLQGPERNAGTGAQGESNRYTTERIDDVTHTEHDQTPRHGQDSGGILPITKSIRPNNGNFWTEDWYTVALRTCVRGMDDGLPRIVDRVARLKALGNAVVPQIVEVIGRAIMEIENQ